jgi:hypothetical protein
MRAGHDPGLKPHISVHFQANFPGKQSLFPAPIGTANMVICQVAVLHLVGLMTAKGASCLHEFH